MRHFGLGCTAVLVLAIAASSTIAQTEPLLLVLSEETNVRPVMATDSRVVLIGSWENSSSTRPSVLWYPDAPAVELPLPAAGISGDGMVVTVRDGNSVGFWSAIDGLQMFSAHLAFGCGETPSSALEYRLTAMASDGSWFTGYAQWNAAGLHICRFGFSRTGPENRAFACRYHDVWSVADVPLAHASLEYGEIGFPSHGGVSFADGSCLSIGSGLPPGTPPAMVLTAKISRNGRVAYLGRCSDAWCWVTRFEQGGTIEQGMVLGALSTVWGISADGDVALLSRSVGGTEEAWLYDHRRSMLLPLRTLLRNAGAIPPQFELNHRYGMSSDGLRFVAMGRMGTEPTKWYYIEIPPACDADLDYSYTNDSDDIIAFFRLYEDGRADFDGDGDTDTDDAAAFFALWDSGC